MQLGSPQRARATQATASTDNYSSPLDKGKRSGSSIKKMLEPVS